jgi:hypothetical protein
MRRLVVLVSSAVVGLAAVVAAPASALDGLVGF